MKCLPGPKFYNTCQSEGDFNFLESRKGDQMGWFSQKNRQVLTVGILRHQAQQNKSVLWFTVTENYRLKSEDRVGTFFVPLHQAKQTDHSDVFHRNAFPK